MPLGMQSALNLAAIQWAIPSYPYIWIYKTWIACQMNSIFTNNIHICQIKLENSSLSFYIHNLKEHH